MLVFFLWVFGVGEVGEVKNVVSVKPFGWWSLADVGRVRGMGIVG